MRSTIAPWAAVVDHDVSAVQGGAASMTAIARRLAPYCAGGAPPAGGGGREGPTLG